MKDKHFEISVRLGDTYFTYSCTKIHEAYEALADIKRSFPGVWADCMDLDDLMETLVRMRNGFSLKLQSAKYSISLCDGEV